MQVGYGALRGRYCLEHRTIAKVQLRQVCILVQIKYLELWKAELARKAAQLVDVEVQFGEENEFVLGCLKGISIRDLILAKFNQL